jgi:preprotein translocase subunit SecE
MAFGLILFWLLDKIVLAVWQIFSEPDTNVASIGAAVVAVATSFTLYRNDRVNQVTHDIVGELTKVTWPSRRETQAATIVVIIASVIAAVVIGVLDAGWSALTDLIY